MRRSGRLVLVAAAMLLASAAPAHAGCPDLPVFRAFEPWGDEAQYAAVPGGDFNAGLDWTVTGAAALVAEPHPFSHDPLDLSAAHLPRDASITSPPVCVTRNHPHIRFAARSLDGKSKLHVEAYFVDLNGSAKRKSLGDNDSKKFARWGLVKEISLKSAFPPEGGMRMVQLRFVTRGGSDGWLVDSVFVDPVKRG